MYSSVVRASDLLVFRRSWVQSPAGCRFFYLFFFRDFLLSQKAYHLEEFAMQDLNILNHLIILTLHFRIYLVLVVFLTRLRMSDTIAVWKPGNEASHFQTVIIRVPSPHSTQERVPSSPILYDMNALMATKEDRGGTRSSRGTSPMLNSPKMPPPKARKVLNPRMKPSGLQRLRGGRPRGVFAVRQPTVGGSRQEGPLKAKVGVVYM